ncbi:peptide chain release factor 1 [Spiroplasma citri]|uniref:Peptide chain release factor 1 n=1 Tax=Spiroplasma citri TaxID=2133 RepID=A0AAJ4EHW9_SPICI|nr:peptide chain release factor 1 [Spiroplasma citri]APE73979.1 peptide chain release factor 1 [Spiroplasma citri]QIA66265.1 peptide chain release factor 1 [Spiroplasma citri]QIA68117.1 peptide chain release factor 1 [Spiroplasma citri]QIA69994.1 peptide chain release factor 1 [Spiroplasma citri]QIA72226.1 peptide chain release factor 1 [Spiroplasma citri]
MNQKTIERLETMLKRWNLINEELTKPEIVNDVKKLTSLAKEQAQLEETVALYLNYKNVLNNINEAKLILETEKDYELIELAKEELKTSEIRKEQLAAELKVILLPKDPNDDKNVIFEIRGAAGGDEGNIFAGDLYRMYIKYAEQQHWKVELIEANESEAGGFSTISFMVKGDRVYSKMKFESGAHRVQRIPKTESKGRVHTSTATVAVLPEIEEVDFEIKTADLKIDTYRASGAGGQHVNTTDSAVRITHLPTGFVVTSQDGRSQHDNKALAMQHLRSKLYEEQQRKINEERWTLRKDAVGTGDRSEKIRTYNYPQNRATDHRINLTLQKLDQIMEGNLDEIVVALINEEQRLKMEGN